jgi:hypothetical protein
MLRDKHVVFCIFLFFYFPSTCAYNGEKTRQAGIGWDIWLLVPSYVDGFIDIQQEGLSDSCLEEM